MIVNNKTKKMKKLILLLTVVAFLSSCETKNVEIKNTDVVIQGTRIQTFVIDSCEYIVGYSWGSHKGNCKYCKKRRMQEMEAIKNHF